MKEVTADFIRLEINRLGSVVVETGLFHPSGVKLHSAGETLTLAHAKALHEAMFTKLYLLEFGEDERTARRSLGVEHVLPPNVELGMVLAEDIRTPAGELLIASGTEVNEPFRHLLQTAAAILAVPIRHRKLAELTQQAKAYQAMHAAPAPEPKPSTTRITRMVHTVTTPTRYLMMPRAKVLVGIADDLLRTMICNSLTSEGHEPVERKSAAAAVDDAANERPHIVLMDLTEALSQLARLRGSAGVRNMAVLVCGEEGQLSQIHNALYSGANDWVPRPPSRDVLSEKIKGCQDLLLRKVQLEPSLQSERRRSDRETTKVICSLRDPYLTNPLPVSTAETVDIGDGGLRLAYNVPRWPSPWAYTPHSVHPRHPLFAYARANPGATDLRVKFPSPRGATVERMARIAHLSPGLMNIEVMGLTFTDGTVPAKPSARKF
jgi:DNA-binding NarL/FixJ family response regulator